MMPELSHCSPAKERRVSFYPDECVVYEPWQGFFSCAFCGCEKRVKYPDQYANTTCIYTDHPAQEGLPRVIWSYCPL